MVYDYVSRQTAWVMGLGLVKHFLGHVITAILIYFRSSDL